MASLLEVRDLHAAYGEAQALEGVSFRVDEGELISLLGRNGAGKTTTLKALMGLEVRRSGSIVLAGRELIAARSYRIARCGMAYCPEDRGIFAGLSVEENLMLPPQIRAGGLSPAEIFALFPNLRERRGSQGTSLSGGEQQMLAIARILRTGARLLLLDEPSEGLAPAIVSQIAVLVRQLKKRGYTILLVEQNLRFARALADRHYIMEGGRIVDELSNAAVGNEADRLARYLSL